VEVRCKVPAPSCVFQVKGRVGAACIAKEMPMAGSIVEAATPREDRSGRGFARGLAVVLCLSIGAIFVAPGAHAQVPELPDVPQPVADAMAQVQEAAIPVLVQVAVQGQAVSNAAGFALRPGCAGVGTAVLLAVLLGGSLPFSPGFVSTPVLIFCAGAFAPGPADPVFDQVDGAAGAQAESTLEPVMDQAGAAFAPVRPQLADVCGAIALAGSTPNQVPPPFNRFSVTQTVCNG
jgi:hypothetical protein